MPAVPLGHDGRYVAAAYVVFFALVLIYVSIMAFKLSRIERELGELNELADRRLGAPGSAAGARGPAEAIPTAPRPPDGEPSPAPAAPTAGGR